MAITILPIHKDGQHQRSLQMMSINDAYTEVRRHTRQLETGKHAANTLFYAEPSNPIVKFVIVEGDSVELVKVAGFNKLTKV